MNRFITFAIMPALITGLATGVSSCGNSAKKLAYPQAPTDSTVVDEYFGIEVADPYRPLENDTAAATLKWVEEENAVTNAYLDKIPFREDIRKRITELNNYTKSGLPWKAKNGKYYYFENDGLQNQSVLYETDNIEEKGKVFLDPNKLSDDGTVALTGIYFSPDAKYAAYTVSRNGSDWSEIYVMDTNTRELLSDHVDWAKFTAATWDSNDGFYYSAYPRPEEGKEFSHANENHQIYYHKIGSAEPDRLVYEDKANPLHFHQAWMPDSKDYLFVTASGEGNGNSVMFRDAKNPNAKWVIMEPSQNDPIEILDVIDGKIYFTTTSEAPNGKLMVADVKNPTRKDWKTLIAERPDAVLESVDLSGDNRLFLSYLKDASAEIDIYSRNGERLGELQLPTLGTVGLSTDKDNDEVYYAFTSFTSPAAVYSYNVSDGSSNLLKRAEIKGFNPDDYVTEQVFFESKDGTKVPMFLTYKKGLEKNGKNPVYLYGYGGFNISLPPSFSANRLLWLENGGIYAQTNLRGGSEYGEKWHEGGIKQNKINVFDDFIAAAEYMINEGWTTPDDLVIEGGSNGGLLVGATVNMRPDLFKVAIPRVGVMDMMRYHLFTIGWNWASDYGTSADSKEMAEYLLSYSPLHTIKNDGTKYPAILITTADHDDRVVPAHSFKYAAELQAADTGDAPKLIRIDSKAGHGGGNPISKIIDEQTDMYSFIFENLGRRPETK